MKGLKVIGMFLLVCASVLSQRSAESAPENALPWVAKQRPELARVADAFAGTWQTTETFEADASKPHRTSGTGTFRIRRGPGGNSVIMDYDSQSENGPYTSTRVIYWDSKESAYRAFYCDSIQPAGCGTAGKGSWQGSDLVFDSPIAGPQGSMAMREKFSKESKGEFTFSLDLVTAGGATRSLTIRAVRE